MLVAPTNVTSTHLGVGSSLQPVYLLWDYWSLSTLSIHAHPPVISSPPMTLLHKTLNTEHDNAADVRGRVKKPVDAMLVLDLPRNQLPMDILCTLWVDQVDLPATLSCLFN